MLDVVVDDVDVILYQSPDEKPPGGIRFLLITWLAPFKHGIVVLISPPAGLYPSPVTGLPSNKISN